jgi:hypothetical protein
VPSLEAGHSNEEFKRETEGAWMGRCRVDTNQQGGSQDLVPGCGTAGTKKSGANKEKPLGIRVSTARHDFVVCVYLTLSVDSDALMNEAMNLALKEDHEERGVRLVRPAHKPFSAGGGNACA